MRRNLLGAIAVAVLALLSRCTFAAPYPPAPAVRRDSGEPDGFVGGASIQHALSHWNAACAAHA